MPSPDSPAAAVTVAVAALALDTAFPLPAAKGRDLSRVLVANDGTALRIAITGDRQVRLGASLADVDPRFVQLLIAYEDRRFAAHPGVDPLAVMRALKQWATSGRVVSGASTLTMQVARLLEPRPRTLRSKGIEMLRALQLEAHLSKREILELYLTLAPYGGNLEGVRAATHAWLGKEPRQLTDAEAALLVVLPQAPSRLRPDRHPALARAARDKVLRQGVKRGVLTEREASLAMRDGVPDARRPFPFHAVHLADRLFAMRPESSVRTPLHASLQVRAEALAAAHAARAGPEAGAAVLVADHRDAMAVRAWVGSPDYLSSPRLGAVDMVRAIRSPGSTLKPFIYGLAIDRALVHPDTRVMDAPRRFGSYAPDNFDRRYRGPVTMAEALRLSLNIPAVAVMDRLGPHRFTHALEAAGVPISLPFGERPGLAVALGGIGLTLDRLVTLYGALGADGRVQPLRLDPDAAGGRPLRLLEAGTAHRVAAILQDAPPPRGAAPARLLAGASRFAAKTGTSFGFRDAWAVGVDGRFVAGVWIGRVDGTPLPGPHRPGRCAAPAARGVRAVAARSGAEAARTGSPPVGARPAGPPEARERLRAGCSSSARIRARFSPRRGSPGPLARRALPAIAPASHGRGRSRSMAGERAPPEQGVLASRRPWRSDDNRVGHPGAFRLRNRMGGVAPS